MLKPIAERLAELLADQQGSKILGLLRLTQLITAERTTDSTSVEPRVPAPNRQVGIWEVCAAGNLTEYVRLKDSPDKALWANVDKIGPKRASRRTVLVGESVARGYLYDPCFNPAVALRNILKNTLGPEDLEVVDLARSDLLLDGLQQIIQESLMLAPDAIVVFAGNNWSAQTFEILRPAIARVLGDGGDLATISLLIKRHLRTLTESFTEWLGFFSNREGIPVIILIPEFNLMDWVPAAFPAAPFLRDGRNAEWFTLRKYAEMALRIRDYGRARELAAELRRLDGGVTIAGAWIEAAAKLNSVPSAEARRLLEAARDAEIWRSVQSTPRCFSTIQDALRRTAPAAGLELIDLPKRLEEYSGGLPDRRLFLDYCHLTSEGINVAMASTVERLLPLVGLSHSGAWRDLTTAACEPSGEVEGDARLLSAIHCAKLGQRFDFVRYHCAAAVKASPRLVEAFGYCLDFQIRRAPNLLCNSFVRLNQTCTPSAARYLLTHGCEAKEGQKPLRRGLMKAAVSVLDAIDRTIGQRAWAHLFETHGVTPDGVSLLQQAYSEEGICSEAQPVDFHRSNQVESKFIVICREQSPLELRMTCRLPEVDGEVRIDVNGKSAGSVQATRQWTTFRLRVDAEATTAGENSVTIHWPVPPTLGEGGLARLRDSLECGFGWELSPVLGEIHSLVVSVESG